MQQVKIHTLFKNKIIANDVSGVFLPNALKECTYIVDPVNVCFSSVLMKHICLIQAGLPVQQSWPIVLPNTFVLSI
jgi:hypothetical protein